MLEERDARLSNDEILRYSRHLIIPDVGMDGQKRLKAARVLCIGAGGLGSPLSLYLAAAGVGTIGIVDFDVVDYTNLQRQILHSTPDVGRKKLDSAAEKLTAINPYLQIRPFETRLTSENAMEILRDFDVVVDGTDNFPTCTARFSVSRDRPACSRRRRGRATGACTRSRRRRVWSPRARREASWESSPAWWG
jgi:molybdopterin/thiamine biosynthesis adenylyltransferase